MNYLKELNAFLDQLELEELSLSASMLWISLMHFNNKVGWKKEFAVPISDAHDQGSSDGEFV